VTFGQRQRLEPMTQMTPLTRLVDAARPDPPSRWSSLTQIERLLADSGRTPAIADTLRSELQQWRALTPAVHAAAVRAPLAGDAVPAAEALGRVADVGLAALHRVQGRIPATAAWQDSARAVLESASGPQGLLRLVVVDAVRWLVEVAPVGK
jgi:hexosaminidase